MRPYLILAPTKTDFIEYIQHFEEYTLNKGDMTAVVNGIKYQHVSTDIDAYLLKGCVIDGYICVNCTKQDNRELLNNCILPAVRRV